MPWLKITGISKKCLQLYDINKDFVLSHCNSDLSHILCNLCRVNYGILQRMTTAQFGINHVCQPHLSEGTEILMTYNKAA